MLSCSGKRTVRAPRLLSAICLVLTATSAFAQLPSAQLHSIFPAGGQVGTSFDVKVTGADLDGDSRLVFSHPGIHATPIMRETEFQGLERRAGEFRITLGDEVPRGTYEVRVVGRFGVTNPRAICVGRLTELNASGNHAFESALKVELENTINAKIDRESRDFYQISLRAGQRLFVDCLAQRIDSRLDGSLILYDENRRELERNHSGLGADPLLDFTAPRDGDYYVALYDFLFRGGPDYFYRLTFHTGPHVDFLYPPSGVPGSTSQVTVYGRNLPGGAASDFQVDGVDVEMLSLDVPVPERQTPLPHFFAASVAPATAMLDFSTVRHGEVFGARLFMSDVAPTIEREPGDDDAGTPQLVSVPAEFTGQLFPAHDVDRVRFEAKKGKVYFIELLAHRLGQSIDPRFVIHKVVVGADGQETLKQVADVDDPKDRNSRIGQDFDTSTDDPSYRLKAGADATYQVTLWDQFDAPDDPRRVYRLVVREPAPDYRLVVLPQAVVTPPNVNVVRLGAATLRRGGAMTLRVRAERRDGFDGEIRLTVSGLPEGLSCRGGLLHRNATTADLVIEATEDAEPWAGSIRVTGRATINGQTHERVARGGAAVWGTANRQQQPPAFRASQDITLAVIADQAPVGLAVESQQVWETCRGGTIEIPIRVARRRGFQGELKLVCHDLPKELKPKDLTVKADAAEAKLVVAATNSKTKAGQYALYLRADATAKLVRDEEAIRIAEQAQSDLQEKVKQHEASQVAEAAPNSSEGATESQDHQAEEKRLREALKTAKKKLADVKKANAAKNTRFVAISSPVFLRIVETPIRLGTSTQQANGEPGSEVQIPVSIERKFGFDDKVDVFAEFPKNTKGLNAGKVTIAKDSETAVVTIKVGSDATLGEHQVTFRASAKFNKVDVGAIHKTMLHIAADKPGRSENDDAN